MKPINHLLVIRMSAMGDVAMSVPVVLALTKQYPSLQVTVLTRAFFKPLFSNLSNVKVHVAAVNEGHKGIFGLWKLYKELKPLKIDAVADIHCVLRSTVLKYYFRLADIPIIQIDKGRAEKRALTSGVAAAFKQLKTTHQRYADVLLLLGFDVDLSKALFKGKEAVPHQFRHFIARSVRKLIGIAPFAAFKGKTYPLHLMEEAVSRLSGSGNYTIVLFGGGEEQKQLLDTWGQKFSNTFSTIGRATFAEELALISNLDVMLAMDSGNAHLTAMYGVPTVTLWGVTHPYAGFAPYAQPIENPLLPDREKFPLIPTSVYGNKMPKGYEKAIETISIEQVLKKINELLD